MSHSIALVNELNVAKRLILKHFGSRNRKSNAYCGLYTRNRGRTFTGYTSGKYPTTFFIDFDKPSDFAVLKRFNAMETFGFFYHK
jgi:hypothetical protein